MVELNFAVLCPGLSLSHGSISYSTSGSSYGLDTVATFTCNSGYSRSGSSSRICNNQGHWTKSNPTCNRGNEELYMLHQVQVVLLITSNHGNQTGYLSYLRSTCCTLMVVNLTTIGSTLSVVMWYVVRVY